MHACWLRNRTCPLLLSAPGSGLSGPICPCWTGAQHTLAELTERCLTHVDIKRSVLHSNFPAQLSLSSIWFQSFKTVKAIKLTEKKLHFLQALRFDLLTPPQHPLQPASLPPHRPPYQQPRCQPCSRSTRRAEVRRPHPLPQDSTWGSCPYHGRYVRLRQNQWECFHCQTCGFPQPAPSQKPVGADAPGLRLHSGPPGGCVTVSSGGPDYAPIVLGAMKAHLLLWTLTDRTCHLRLFKGGRGQSEGGTSGGEQPRARRGVNLAGLF